MKAFMLNRHISGLCTALTIKLAQNGLQFVDNLNDFPENDPKFLFDMAEERNWGYSVLFINDNDKVRAFCPLISNIL